MLPAGLAFVAISEKARAASKSAKLPRAFWDWTPVIAAANGGNLPYTPACNLFFGLQEALDMIAEEGAGERLRPPRPPCRGDPARGARPWAWRRSAPSRAEYSQSVTAVFAPEGHSADRLRQVILECFSMSLGAGLGKLADKGVPHRPPGRLQRSDARRDVKRRGDGIEFGRRPASQGRRPGGAGLPGGWSGAAGSGLVRSKSNSSSWSCLARPSTSFLG